MPSRTPEELDLEARIVARLADPDYRPVKPRTLAKKLLVTPEQTKLFRHVVKRLVIDGRITWGDQHYLRPIRSMESSQSSSSESSEKSSESRKSESESAKKIRKKTSRKQEQSAKSEESEDVRESIAKSSTSSKSVSSESISSESTTQTAFSWKELEWDADDPNAQVFEALEAVIGDEAEIPFCKAELRRNRPDRNTTSDRKASSDRKSDALWRTNATLWKGKSTRKRSDAAAEFADSEDWEGSKSSAKFARLAKSSGKSSATDDRIVGIFQRHEAGFGFVRPQRLSDTGERLADVHIPVRYTMDAATGDRVEVQLRRSRPVHRRGFRDRDRGPTGEIVAILERGQQRFVGTFFSREGNGWVQLDGTAFPNPIFVGDCSNHAVQPRDKVVVEIVCYPTRNSAGEATITEVLGSVRDAGVDTQMVMREFNLPDHFDDDVLDEARMEARAFETDFLDNTDSLEEAETLEKTEGVAEGNGLLEQRSNKMVHGRLDLTSATIVTIDPEDARDFDDAISLQRVGSGWRLGVHIADVSRFVRPDTALDREAYQRGTSVYLPDRVIPMLPEILSNGLASLQPDKRRYTKSVFIDFSPEGTRLNVTLANTIICNKRRFSYEEVDEFLESETEPSVSRRTALGTEVYHLLLRMRELSRILRERRQQRGAIELDFSDVRVDLDRDGRVTGGHTIPHTESRRIVEDFMLAANEAVAETLSEADFAFLRRIHPAPSAHKTEQLGEFLVGLGYQGESLEDRWSLQRLLEHSRGKPEATAIQYAVLRSLQKAVYSPKDEPHFALAAKHYTHFTSPIRRYPDLTIHRLVDEYIRSVAVDGAVATNGSVADGSVTSTTESTASSGVSESVSPVSSKSVSLKSVSSKSSKSKSKSSKLKSKSSKLKSKSSTKRREVGKESKQYRNLWLLGEHCTRCEQQAEDAERTLVKLKLLGWLRDRVGSIFEGVITGTARYGFFVQPLEVPIEGLVSVESLPGPHDYDESAHTLSSRRRHHVYRAGDPVHVAVKRVNLLKRQLDFELVQHRSRTEKSE